MDIGNVPDYRRIYAQQILAKAGVDKDPRLLAAFARVLREHFVGPPPWIFNDLTSYRQLPSADPVVLYQDMLVGLDAEKGINNGMPSLHAATLHQFGIREGETAVHLGAGVGYYTAIIAELVGPSGRVVAVEYDAALASRAKANLASYANVEVVQGNAAEWPKQEADIVYANFALDHLPAAWVDNLADYGRLIFPLGIPAGENDRQRGFSRYAGFLMIDRRPKGFGARFLQPVSFIWGEGQEPAPPGRHSGLEAAFRSRRALHVRSLRWGTQPKGDEWYGEADWGLCFDEP
jgi:protein-L-isoaspartate(D-aspartate) O-methyltransferase